MSLGEGLRPKGPVSLKEDLPDRPLQRGDLDVVGDAPQPDDSDLFPLLQASYEVQLDMLVKKHKTASILSVLERAARQPHEYQACSVLNNVAFALGRIDHGNLDKHHPLAAMGPRHGRRPCPGKNRPWKPRSESSTA